MENWIPLCKDTSDWCLRPEEVQMGHLSQECGPSNFFYRPFHLLLYAMPLLPHLA